MENKLIQNLKFKIKNLKFLAILLITNLGLIINSGDSFAQQDGQFSQYMFNPFVINPAYAGSRDALSVLLVGREQWLSMPGAPSTQTLSINSKVKNRVGLGLQIFNDAIGPKNVTGYLGTYAYRFPLFKGKLAFGLRFGAFTYKYHWDKIEYKDPNDVYNTGNVTQTTVLNSDFGAFYNTKTYYFGLSYNHLGGNSRITSTQIPGADAQLSSHIFITAGKTFEINDNLALQPSILVRAVEGAPINTDINFNMLLNKKIWFGVSYRTSKTIVLLSQFYATDKLRFGYSFDYGMNRIGKLGGGTHELFIGYDFDVQKNKTISPRYF